MAKSSVLLSLSMLHWIYEQLRTGASMCTFEDCDRQVFAKELCKTHYQQRIKGMPLSPLTKGTAPTGERMECGHPPCTRLSENRGYCQTHYKQSLSGAPLRDIPDRGECEFPGCRRQKKSRTLCAAHHQQQKEGRELKPLRAYKSQPFYCTADGCGSESHAKGLCRKHYARGKG